MNVLNAIRNHPLHLALALALAFGSWVAYDGSGGPHGSNEPIDAPPVDTPNVAELPPPQMFDHTNSAQARDPSRPGVVTADLIPRLQPGMERVAVERLIGQPPAGLVDRVSLVGKRYVYRASYLANLDSGPSMSAPAARSIIALEYDAGQPGHPLLKVHIP